MWDNRNAIMGFLWFTNSEILLIFMDRVPDTSRSVYKRDLIDEFIDSTLVSIKWTNFLASSSNDHLSSAYLIIYYADEIFHWTRLVNCVFNLLYTNNRYTE